MAILNEFLGAVVSSVSNARVQSDLQTIKIAGEYAKNDLLQHFAVPRMRFSDVEIKIPVAIASIQTGEPRKLELIDNTRFVSVAYNEILATMRVDKLPAALSKAARSLLATQTRTLETALKSDNNPKVLQEFTITVSAMLAKQFEAIVKGTPRPVLQREGLAQFQETLSRRLLTALEKELKPVAPVGPLSGLEVIVEADKLKEIDQRSIIMITMKISEEGMEWHTTENNKGEAVSKLIPE